MELAALTAKEQALLKDLVGHHRDDEGEDTADIVQLYEKLFSKETRADRLENFLEDLRKLKRATAEDKARYAASLLSLWKDEERVKRALQELDREDPARLADFYAFLEDGPLSTEEVTDNDNQTGNN